MSGRSEVSISENWKQVLERVAKACKSSGRNPDLIKVVAVSKTFGAEAIERAFHAGVRVFGESYIQEALPKIHSLTKKPMFSDIQWHFVGALQSNKADQALKHFSLIHSLDRWSLAKALEKHRQKTQQGCRALVQVNMADETTKAGVQFSACRELVKKIAKETGIEICGLMTFPPYFENPEDARPYFQKLKALAQEVEEWKLPRVKMSELSMGVTNDFDVAIEEGATFVRIGTAIFGPRRKLT